MLVSVISLPPKRMVRKWPSKNCCHHRLGLVVHGSSSRRPRLALHVLGRERDADEAGADDGELGRLVAVIVELEVGERAFR